MSGTIIGIDPGYSGAICVVRDCVSPALSFYRFALIGDRKARDYDIAWIDELIRVEMVYAPPTVFVEAFASFALSANIVQSLVRCVTIVETVCRLRGVPCHVVKSQAWQKAAFEGTPAEMKPKARARLAAARIFPTYDHDKWTEGERDARLIAWYGERNTNH